MEPILNVALVGYGYVGKTFHAPLVAHTPGLHLHTVVSSDPQKVLVDFPQARVVDRAHEAFADPDIHLVVVAAPNAVHASLACDALAQGKHVVVDKPFTVTLQEARSVVAQATQSGRLLSVFQNRRWDSDFLTLKQLLQKDALGEVSEFHSHFDRHRPQVVDRWREQDQPGSGLWFDLGPHLLDQSLQLFGMPQAIYADIALQRTGAQAADYFHALLRYPRHRVVLHAGSLVPANGLRFAVHGTRASYLKHGLDTQEATLRAGGIPGQTGWGIDTRVGRLQAGDSDEGQPIPAIAGDYRHYYRELRAAILDNTAPPVTAQQALDVMALLEWGMQSSTTHREMDCTAAMN